jgi:hypothetical protein
MAEQFANMIFAPVATGMAGVIAGGTGGLATPAAIGLMSPYLIHPGEPWFANLQW